MRLKRNAFMSTWTVTVLNSFLTFWSIVLTTCDELHALRLQETPLSGSSGAATKYQCKFTKSSYDVVIAENSIGKTYATPILYDDKIGVQLCGTCSVTFRIVAGDRDRLFKVEERVVGNFAFLSVRTRYSNVVLNREKHEDYLLLVKAFITCLGGGTEVDVTYEPECDVHLKVLDRNDLSPLFYPTEYFATIPEDLALHSSVVKVSAEDADLGVNGEIYYSFLNDESHFIIHPSSGVISCVRPLIGMGGHTLLFVVLATDRGSAINHLNQQSSKANVTIQIEQRNLYSPEIHVSTISHVIINELEDVSQKTIAIVCVTDRDSGRHGQIRQLKVTAGDPDGLFYITANLLRGDEYYIRLKKLVVFANATNSFNLTVRAYDNGIPEKSSELTVHVTISIEKHNAPIFTKQLYEVSIPESSPPYMPVIRLKVTDPIFRKNALVYLEIVGGNEGGEFKINPETGMLYTQKALDAEKTSFYALTVSAVDQANLAVRKQSSAKVKISVLDINDNDPVFEQRNFTVFLNENELSGAYVAKVNAKDKDSGENAFLSYSIANLRDVPFDIDHFSGVIRTSALIDYEVMRRSYKLKVRASDWGLPYRRQSEIDVHINIRDVNDNRPQFERVNCAGSILRRAPIGTDVFRLSAIDFDSGDYITYRLISGNEDGCFILDPTSGVITVGCDLDDVEENRRSINVSATDGTHFSDEMVLHLDLLSSNQFSLKGYSSIECQETGVAKKLSDLMTASEMNNLNEHEQVDDVFFLMPNRYGQNMHKPEFVSFPLALRINESLNLGDTITWFKAKDKDLGYNGKLVYGIAEGDIDSVFRVDPDSGELQLIGYLDRERQDKYTLNITVCDLGLPSKCDDKMVTVNIQDINDNPPVFLKPVSRLHLSEDTVNGTEILCLSSTDADLEANAMVEYSLKSGMTVFTLNATTGCLVLTGTLDREKQAEHELHIFAKDCGTPSLSADATVTITVADVNDNAPEFGVQEMIFKIREDLPRGTVVAKVDAHDFDSGTNGDFLFFLKEDNANLSVFNIDKHSGVIRTKDYLDYETQQIFNLVVSAVDCGTPQLSSDMPVVIEIIDVNENRYAPEFDDFVFVAKVKENVPKGTTILNITAKDMDHKGLDSEVVYSICCGDGVGTFSVNDKGTVRTLSHLDAETKNYYWLTLCAQDQAVVPLVSCAQVYIEVEDVNDNAPMTEQPVYYTAMTEASRPRTLIIQLNATDDDISSHSDIRYKIISGNPEGFFELNKTTGELFTTERKLDRENQAEHILEINISDTGYSSLYSTTRVVIAVEDVNDNAPQFDQRFYKVQVPSSTSVNASIFQVLATDADSGENGRLSYGIKSGKGKNKFRIDVDTGMIYAIKPIEGDTEYELVVKVDDHGTPKRSQTTRLNIVVVPIPGRSPHPPAIKTKNSVVEVTESDKTGFLVTLIQAIDEDSDYLWYNISGGNEDNAFYIGHDNGNVLLSKSLDWETRKFYNLTIGVNDGSSTEETQLYVKVVDVNDNRPQFSRDVYFVNISENTREETTILQLQATDEDEEKKIYYTLHGSKDPSSLLYFRIDSVTGNVVVTQRLDYERKKRHELIVIAKDQGTPAKRNYAKVVVSIYDHNDHYPEFTSKMLQRKIPESSELGSKIVQLSAIDRDCGKNGELTYSIVSGNVGNVFKVDVTLGTLFLSHRLNILHTQEYMLQVKAIDHGSPPLSSQMPVHVIVVMTESDPPRFNVPSVSLEIYENMPIGSYVTHFEVQSSSSVFYNIVAGNEGGQFYVNPSTGVMLVNDYIDYETKKDFNLTLKASNMAAATSVQNVTIHILDVNDNPPRFVDINYFGEISEAFKPGECVRTNDSRNSLLQLKAIDDDVGQNSILEFTIMDEIASKYFKVDSLTGTIQLITAVDFESTPMFHFKVMVNDKGTPELNSHSLATVRVHVIDVNDCPPVFVQENVNVTLHLPTFEGVLVTTVTAKDMDSHANQNIRYDIVDGNVNNSFEVNNTTGLITTRTIYELRQQYTLHVRASDGIFSTIAKIHIHTAVVGNTGFQFQSDKYEFSMLENSTKVSIIGLVNVEGNLLSENVVYRILNPTHLFEIGHTSGAIRTKGVAFDRELIDKYSLIVEATSMVMKSNTPILRRAVTRADVAVLDVNDNCPIFVNLPYYGTVSLEDSKGFVVLTVKAIDLDSQENGEVRYEMKKGNGELFKVDRKSGDIVLKQKLNSIDAKYELLLAAYDNAPTPCYTEVFVLIKIVDKSMPVFSKQFYYKKVREDIELFSAVSVDIHAESPLQRNLIYTATSMNEDFFEIDYRTGVLYVVNNLDYEHQKSHEMLVRATDVASGAYAEVVVSIGIEDANDCYPTIESDNYNLTLPENTALGAQIFKLSATDCDSDANSVLSYVIESTNGRPDSTVFYMNIADGSLHLKRQLDYEECKSYMLTIIVRDHGTPSLMSRANVWIKVKDVNDNPPKFVEPSFSYRLSQEAVRGQQVLRASANDADECDTEDLRYKIVDGNEHQVFSIQKQSGIIVLQNKKWLETQKQTVLNISVTDGIHTSYARVKITLLPENLNSPIFENQVYDAVVAENEEPNKEIVTVQAYDKDFGHYGSVRYDITDDNMAAIFEIDSLSGLLRTKVSLDREQMETYDILIRATDGGGKFSYASVKVMVSDVNDNAPKFGLKEYNWVVADDTSVGSFVGKVTARDIDEGNNSLLNYTLEDAGDVNSLVSISSNGELVIISSLQHKAVDVLQFFVRVTDNGDPVGLSSIASVSLQIVSANVTMPTFEKAMMIITVGESCIPGTVLARLKVTGNFSVKFSLATDTNKFSVAENGDVKLIEPVDRETSEVEHVIAMSETTTQPVLYAYADLYFYIQDENDNSPQFSRLVYNLDIPENNVKGTAILKVSAKDVDQGPNGDVRYYIEDDALNGIFEVDLHTGWITQIINFDRETISEYYFNVLASDNGQSKQISKVPISVSILDYNDNPPIFQQTHYSITVPENAILGTVLTTFLLTDMDIESKILDFFILAGDSFAQFQISNTGELFVSKELDRETLDLYNLTIAATDGKYVSYCSVSVQVSDVNDNYPICVIPRYVIRVNESVAIGTVVAKINTVDLDDIENNRIRFYLTGNHSDDFFVDKDSSALTVARTLDRESISLYNIKLHAQDGKDLLQECICEVIVYVSDVNDNQPIFSVMQYIANVPEDAQVGVIIAKVHAIDNDYGVNRKLLYFFEDPVEFFEITPNNGIVRLTRALDREKISAFNLVVWAQDSGLTQLSATANLTIHVLDINDNPPEFLRKEYAVVLFENAVIGTEVVRVHANSKDIGVNAEIWYHIVGGNEQQRFRIDRRSGTVSLGMKIDYERTKSFYLIVQAVDGGTPPLSSQAFVNISVLDVNDNKPQFSQNLYRLEVGENAIVGTHIAQLTATDDDSGQNGVIVYNVERGDRHRHFSIDPTSGSLYVYSALDREQTSSYVLEVRACDRGEPTLCSFVQVFIDIQDVNDNAPYFKLTNLSVVLQESKALGFTVIKFEVIDLDEYPNANPYTFDFKQGNEGGFFRMEQDGSLRTALRFNHKICDEYRLQIRVFDNGSPPLFSDSWITVKIIEESQFPPVITPLEVTVNSYEDDFVGGYLGKVFASDQDKYDTVSYFLGPTSGQGYASHFLFNISATSGELFAIKNLDVGQYQVNVTASDGKFEAHAVVRVNVEMITRDMTKNYVIMKLGKVTATEFILSHRKSFVKIIREILRCRQKDIVIIALSQSEDVEINEISRNNSHLLGARRKQSPFSPRNGHRPHSVLEIVFAVQKQQIVPSSESFYSSEEILHALSQNIDEIEDKANLPVEELVSSECDIDICAHGKCHNQLSLNKSRLLTFFTDVVSYVTPTYKVTAECTCKQGFAGRICDEAINACSLDPCSPQKQCWPADTQLGYQCICPSGFSGQFCEIQSIKCLQGNCSASQTSVSFSGKSYAHYKVNKAAAKTLLENQFSMSLNVRTLQQSGTLVYASGKVDYNIIEIVNGLAQYRFDLGSGEGIIHVSGTNVSDGLWHSIKLERVLNTAKLVVDNKYSSQGSTPGVNVILNLQSNDIFIGAKVKPHHTIMGYEDIQRGFIGCMAEISIGHEALPLYISGGSTVAALKRFTNIEFLCDPSKVLVNLGICGGQPCLNSGMCQDLGDQFICICPQRFTGQYCEIDLDPCASVPCLYGGTCEHLGPSNYTCNCPSHLSGRRCEYGRYCIPNPCQNGGICEEGDGVSHCMCRGFTGPTCEIDVDECENQPCGSGATCINEAGSFRCICPTYLTGASCGDPLYSNSISTKLKNFSVENITGILCGISLVFVVCTITLFCIIYKRTGSSDRTNGPHRLKPRYQESALNSIFENEKNNKHNTKITNLEVNHRPISYTPATTDNIATSAHFVNNLDILRSYGSAGDELENIPFEYQKINLNKQNVNINNDNISEATASSYKTEWCDQTQLKTFCENKLNNGKTVEYALPLNRLTSIKHGGNKLIHVTMPNVCQSTPEYSAHGQYHWDCSDWARSSQNPLPDITEVPGAEIADSSSFHSNESNESRSKIIQSALLKVDPDRDIATLDEDLVSDSVDSEMRNSLQELQFPLSCNSLSRLSPAYCSESEDYTLNPVPLRCVTKCKLYLRHPDTYLPPLNNLSETDADSNPHILYAPREAAKDPDNRKLSVNSEEVYLCRASPYNSTHSVHLCEIEDSELEEFLPKNRTTTSRDEL